MVSALKLLLISLRGSGKGVAMVENWFVPHKPYEFAPAPGQQAGYYFVVWNVHIVLVTNDYLNIPKFKPVPPYEVRVVTAQLGHFLFRTYDL